MTDSYIPVILLGVMTLLAVAFAVGWRMTFAELQKVRILWVEEQNRCITVDELLVDAVELLREERGRQAEKDDRTISEHGWSAQVSALIVATEEYRSTRRIHMAEERDRMEKSTQETRDLLEEAVQLLQEQRERDEQGPATTTHVIGWWRDRADNVIGRWQGSDRTDTDDE